MTTRRFSAINLPNPRYSLEVGKFDLRQTQDLNLSIITSGKLMFCDNIHYVECIRESGTIIPGHGRAHLSQLITTNVIIEDVRPELFLRRDFISKFIDNGRIYLVSQASNNTANDCVSTYCLSCAKNNVLTILMNEKQYRRFGLVAKKVTFNRGTGMKRYKIEIDLADKRIKRSNKFQDKLFKILRRLNPVNKVYFRFYPNNLTSMQKNCNYTTTDKNPNTGDTHSMGTGYAQEALKFFNCVIDEYAKDGFKPVPLARCYLSSQKIERSWTNYNQLHPDLSLSDCLVPDSRLLTRQPTTKKVSQKFDSTGRVDQKGDSGVTGGIGHRSGSHQNGDVEGALSSPTRREPNKRNNNDHLSSSSGIIKGEGSDTNIKQHLVDVIDWLGYQLLGVDCDRVDEIRSIYPQDSGRLDVACSHLSGTMDFEHIEKSLRKVFNTNNIDNTSFRALILYYNQPLANNYNTPMGADMYQSANTIDINHQSMSSSSSSSSFSNNRAGVFLIQDCAKGSEAANLITVVGMSALAN